MWQDAWGNKVKLERQTRPDVNGSLRCSLCFTGNHKLKKVYKQLSNRIGFAF